MSEFKLVDGVSVPDLTGIEEGYSMRQTEAGFWQISINVSADHLRTVYLDLCRRVESPTFAYIEIPTNESEEEKLRSKSSSPFHKDVYYFDNLAFDAYLRIFDQYERFFINDGMITFGFGSHKEIDEVRIERYKLVEILTTIPENYLRYLEFNSFPKKERLRTVFDNFSEEAPGNTRLLEYDGKTIYEMTQDLSQKGFYFAERRDG
jgi:hypothetical protein